jgi:hypothetical protein
MRLPARVVGSLVGRRHTGKQRCECGAVLVPIVLVELADRAYGWVPGRLSGFPGAPYGLRADRSRDDGDAAGAGLAWRNCGLWGSGIALGGTALAAADTV